MTFKTDPGMSECKCFLFAACKLLNKPSAFCLHAVHKCADSTRARSAIVEIDGFAMRRDATHRNVEHLLFVRIRKENEVGAPVGIGAH